MGVVRGPPGVDDGVGLPVPVAEGVGRGVAVPWKGSRSSGAPLPPPVTTVAMGLRRLGASTGSSRALSPYGRRKF